MTFKKGLLKSLSFYLSALLFISCNAPRDNPLDPLNPNSSLIELKASLGIIEGTVQSFSAPFIGIPDVSVFWPAENILVKTDESGNFSIVNIKPDDGKLFFQKKGYTSDSLDIVWNSEKKITLPVINLNKIPTLENSSIYSEVIDQVAKENMVASQTANLNFKVKINDPDNDVDSVFIKNDAHNFTGGLILQGKIYQGNSKLNITDLEEIVGYDFDIWVIDIFNRSYWVGSSKVARVIKNGAELLSPVNNDTVSTPIILNWTQFDAGYSFTYKVEIYNAANPQPVFMQDNIPSNQLSLNVDTSLIVSGDYFWAVTIVDKFWDSYKPLPGRFHVQ